jgi:DNA-binding NtrC family response regulator
MSLKERQAVEILVCEDKIGERNNIKMALRMLNYGLVTDAPSLSQGLKKIEGRNFSHIIFQARKSDITAADFLQSALASCPNTIFLAASFEPTVDNIFSLLIGGARGYLVCPFTTEALDTAILQASLGEGFPEELLLAKDRNEALMSIAMSNLDRVATTLRQAKKYDILKHQTTREMDKFRVSANMAKIFCEGGESGFFSSLDKFAEKRSSGPATKLGRLRKRLNNARHS